MLCHVSGWYEFDWREESSTAVNAIHTKEDDAGKIFTVKRDQQGTFLCLHSCCFWATICKTVCPSAIGPLSVCLSCNVGILRPNSWMDQDVTWHGGRPWPRRHCVALGSSSLTERGTAVPPPVAPPTFWPTALARLPISATAELLLFISVNMLASDTSVRSLVLRTVPLSLLFSCYCYCCRCHGCSLCVSSWVVKSVTWTEKLTLN